MWIIAGPNGAGKSSFAGEFLADLGYRNLTKLNADEKTLELRHQFPGRDIAALNLEAARFIDGRVDECISRRESFVVETVLSSDKYRSRVIAAKAAGIRVGMIYVSVWPPEMSPKRVKVRAAKGGHDVDEAKALDRYRRSHEQLAWFAPQTDALIVFDNTAIDGGPALLATKSHHGARLHIQARGVNLAVDKALNIRPLRHVKPNEPTP